MNKNIFKIKMTNSTCPICKSCEINWLSSFIAAFIIAIGYIIVNKILQVYYNVDSLKEEKKYYCSYNQCKYLIIIVIWSALSAVIIRYIVGAF